MWYILIINKLAAKIKVRFYIKQAIFVLLRNIFLFTKKNKILENMFFKIWMAVNIN